MEELLKLVGLGTPVLYAWGVYSLFHWLDKNLSDEAKASLSRLTEVRHYNNKAVSAAIIEIFNLVYTHTLFTWRAFFRSAAITILVSAIYIYEVDLIPVSLRNTSDFLRGQGQEERDVLFVGALVGIGVMMSLFLFLNILSDYISLFVIKQWLRIAGHRAVIALLVSSLIFIFIIVISYVLRRGVWLLVVGLMCNFELSKCDPADFLISLFTDPFHPPALLIPTLFVFAWLPLFGISLIIIRSINLLSPTVEKVKWFIKGGKITHWMRWVTLPARLYSSLQLVGEFFSRASRNHAPRLALRLDRCASARCRRGGP
jgi:hypothetical protein